MPGDRRHGYGGYSNGCRCEVCAGAKAAYVRAYRARRGEVRAAARRRGARNLVTGIKHGYAGYQEHGCRCETCTAAKAASDARRRAKCRLTAS